MISFEEALQQIKENGFLLREESVPIGAALGRINSRDLRSPLSLPSFNNSAMDGFAFCSKDTSGATTEKPVFLKIAGAIRAGDEGEPLEKNTTVRIMTGAVLPHGADTVLENEKAMIRRGSLRFDGPVPEARNVRYKGEEITKGDRVLPKGALIHPGIIGFLAAMGMDRVHVYQKPNVSLIGTGNELTEPGFPLRTGKIYDSNTAMVQAALDEMKIRPVFVRRVPDEKNAIRNVIRFALGHSDFLILMGGVSSGDHDHVKEMLKKSGVRTLFWKISQKPGMPLYFGRKNKCLVFGLPGNPASVFTCFYEYVYPAIRRAMGHANPYLAAERMPVEEEIRPDRDRFLFLKGKISQNGSRAVLPLKHQRSHMLSSLCETNGLVVVPNSEQPLKKGEKALVHLLP